MKIARSTIYAIIIMAHIAENWNKGCVSLKSIADKENLSVKYLEQIGNALNKAGLIQSSRGPHGGYKLKKPPEYYTVKMIIEVMDGGLMQVYRFRQQPLVPDRFQALLPFLYPVCTICIRSHKVCQVWPPFPLHI